MKRSLKALTTMALAVGMAGIWGQASFAAEPYGNWKRPKNGAHIKVYRCGGGLGMKVLSSPNKKSVGKRLMCGAKKSGKKWSGTLTSSEDGKTYSGTVSLTKKGRLKLQGCAFGVFCKTEYWKRL